MDIICKPKYNAIFWRNSEDEPWRQTNLTEVIQAYERQDYCELEYWTTVHTTSGMELYSMFTCDKCDKIVAALDKEHGLVYCPHCGRAIWRD